MSWAAHLRCSAGHFVEAQGAHTNVDGHFVVPIPEVCSSCAPPLAAPREPTFLERRRLRRAIRRLERGGHR